MLCNSTTKTVCNSKGKQWPRTTALRPTSCCCYYCTGSRRGNDGWWGAARELPMRLKQQHSNRLQLSPPNYGPGGGVADCWSGLEEGLWVLQVGTESAGLGMDKLRRMQQQQQVLKMPLPQLLLL